MCKHQLEIKHCPTYVTNPEHPDHIPVRLSDLSPGQFELFKQSLLWRRQEIGNGVRALQTTSNPDRSYKLSTGHPQPNNWVTYYPEIHRANFAELVKQLRTPVAQAVAETVALLQSGQLSPVPTGREDLSSAINSITDNHFRQLLGGNINNSILQTNSRLPNNWFYNVRRLLVVDELDDQFSTELNYLLTDEQGSLLEIPISLIYMAAEFGTFTNLIVSLRESWVYSWRFNNDKENLPVRPESHIEQHSYQRRLPEGIVTCPAAKLMMFYMNLFDKCKEDPELWERFTQEDSANRLIQASSMLVGGVECFFE